MNAKQLKFLQLFSDLAKVSVLEPVALRVRFKPLLELDFAYGVDAWEYMTTVYESDLSKSKVLSEFFGEDLLKMFSDKAALKTVKAISETASIRRFVYAYNPKAGLGISQQFLVDALNGSKFSFADETLKEVNKNANIKLADVLKDAIEKVIIELLKKSTANNKKIEMPKKMATLLLEHIKKVKTGEKPMLEQRIKEVL